MTDKPKIGIIGGSGFYALFSKHEQTQEHLISTPFGEVKCIKGTINNIPIIFLPRHGAGHSVPPHMINYKANIYALFEMGVKQIISTNAVGSVKSNLEPGHFVILDQFIDLVSGAWTYFDGSFEIEIDGKMKKGVVHLDMTEPYSHKLRGKIIETFKEFPEEIYHRNGCYIMNNGPRFETPAEIKLYQQFGDLVGMTNAPECILSKELEMEYATICLVTNFAAGMQKEITHQEVIDLFNDKIDVLISIIRKVITRL